MFGVLLVEIRETAHISQKACCFYDMVNISACRCQDSFDILADTFGLFGYIAAAQFTSGRIQRDLAGDKQQVADNNGL